MHPLIRWLLRPALRRVLPRSGPGYMMIFLLLADPTHTNYSRVRVTGGGIQCEVLSAHLTGAVVRAIGCGVERLMFGLIKTSSPWIKFRSADSSSTNAVNFSSARTTKRFPSLRCASATKIVRPSESKAETQPQPQPALLRLSAMISQYRDGLCLFCSPRGNHRMMLPLYFAFLMKRAT